MMTYWDEFQSWCAKYEHTDMTEMDFVGWMQHYHPKIVLDWGVRFPINYPENIVPKPTAAP